jgi:Mn2+/Fe2+ NRAMP family transporter
MSSKQAQMGSLRDSAVQKKKRKLPDWMRLVLNGFFIIPALTTFAYASEMWKPDGDGLDDILVSGAVFAGIGGVILINFVIKYLEDIGD